MADRKKFSVRNLLFILAIIGPGIITATVDNDAGGITTYSVAGAAYGYDILWVLIPVTILLIIVQEMSARMGAVTGKGFADLIRERFGLKITMLLLITLLFANLSITISEFAGIAAAGELFGISKLAFIPICAAIVLVLILRLNYSNIEKFFLGLAFFYVCYIISGFMARPDWGEILHKTVAPSFAAFSPAYLYVVIGIIGTTITPWMQFYLQSSIVEKGIRVKDYKYSRLDVIIGCIITDVIAFFIIVAVAAALFSAGGVQINSAKDAAMALEPLAGAFAFMLFGFGLFVAAFFGAFILPLATAFHTCEGIGWESGVNKSFSEAPQFYSIIIFLIAISALFVILMPSKYLIPVMVVTQVINGMVLPFILIASLVLINDKKIMGDYTNSALYNAVVWISIFITIIITIAMALTSLF